MKLRLFAALAIAGALIGGAPAAADTITLDNGRKMTVDKSVSVATPQPQIKLLVIVVHGEDRNYDDYWSRMTTAAEMAGVKASTQIVSPQFRESSSSGFMHWPATDWRHGANDARYGVSAFAAMDGLVRRFTDATIYPNLERVVIVGHSAGGQFVQRYALTSTQVPRVPQKLVAGNAGSYAYVTPSRKVGGQWVTPNGVGCSFFDNWHYGLNTLNSYGASTGVAAMFSTFPADDVTYLIGADDITPRGSDDDCAELMQGAHRRQRGEWFFEHVGLTFPGHNHKFVLVPGVEHSSSGLFQSPEGRAVIFGTNQTARVTTSTRVRRR